MKEFRLSTPAERIVSIVFTVFITICFGGLLFVLRNNLGLLIFCGISIALIMLLLGIYVVNVLKAVCIADPEKKTIQCRGIPNQTYDISSATLLQTLPKKNGQTTIRTLVFSDADDKIVAVIPTMFTFRQGKMAEPMAEEMAKHLDIPFKRNIPEWEFDKELYKEHVKQVAAEEKAASKARREARMKYRINKRKKDL